MNNFIEQVLKEDYGFSEEEITGYLKCRDKLQEDSLQLDTNSLSVRNTCEWEFYEDEWSSYYETDCSQACCFDFGTLAENHYKFCPYCGKRIVEKGIKE